MSAPPIQPPSPQTDDILVALYTAAFNLPAAAAALGLAFSTLLQLLRTPDVREAFADLCATTEEFLSLRASQARITSINTLEKSALAASDPIEQRRSGSALYRATNLGAPRAARSSDRSALGDGPRNHDAAHPAQPSQKPSRTAKHDQTDAEASAHPDLSDSPEAPETASSPDHLYKALITALIDPAADHVDVAETLHKHAAPGMTLNGSKLPAHSDRFADDLYISLLPHLYSAAPLEHCRVSADSDAAAFTFLGQPVDSATPPIRLDLTLARSNSSSSKRCWRIAAIRLVEQPRNPP